MSQYIPFRSTVARLAGAAITMAVAASAAVAYIHFPPMALPKMCKQSTNIRVLEVKKYDKDKGVIVFEAVEDVKGKSQKPMSFRQVIRPDAEGVKAIFDWAQEKKRAVLFTIEGGNIACGYVFIDGYCYSVDQNRRGDFWMFLRADPQMSTCYFGSTEKLQQITKEILAGKTIDVPTKEVPITKEDRDKRVKDVNDVLKENRR
jgi:hypothetical protein